MKKMYLFTQFQNNGESEAVKAQIIKEAFKLKGTEATESNTVELNPEDLANDTAQHMVSLVDGAHCEYKELTREYKPEDSLLPEGTVLNWVYDAGVNTQYFIYIPL